MNETAVLSKFLRQRIEKGLPQPLKVGGARFLFFEKERQSFKIAALFDLWGQIDVLTTLC